MLALSRRFQAASRHEPPDRALMPADSSGGVAIREHFIRRAHCGRPHTPHRAAVSLMTVFPLVVSLPAARVVERRWNAIYRRRITLKGVNSAGYFTLKPRGSALRTLKTGVFVGSRDRFEDFPNSKPVNATT